MVVLIVSYLLLVFLVPLLLSAVIAVRALPRIAACSQCGGQAIPLATRARRLLRVLGLELRWCLACGRQGWTRRPARAGRGRRSPAGRAEAASAPPVPSLALDVRSLRVDGQMWRVQLHWWREAAACHGRLVFIEPTGRRVRDAVQSFTGATQFEVLGQALSLPDPLLKTRLRQLLTSER